MSLPKLNTPIFKMTIPSTGKTVNYRPFLVKEQKMMLMAGESKDEDQIIQATKDIIKSCVQGDLNVEALASFDLEYMLLQIRAKSVGEKVNLAFRCKNQVTNYVERPDGGEKVVHPEQPTKECGGKIEVDVDLNEITVPMPEKGQQKIHVGTSPNGDVGVVLKYPSFQSMNRLRKADFKDPSVIDLALTECIDYVYDGDAVYSLKEATPEERTEFFDSLPQKATEQIGEFIKNIPRLSKKLDLFCPKCKNKTTYTVEGIDSFFM